MRTPSLFIFGIILFLMSSCEKQKKEPDPVACFSPSEQLKKPFEPISFLNCSENYDRLLWDFGDGVTSDVVYPSHSWTKSGSYDVKLTAFRKNKPSSATKRVVIAKTLQINCYMKLSNIKEPWASGGLEYSLYLVRSDSSRQFISGKVCPPPLPYIQLSAVAFISGDDPFGVYHLELIVSDATGKVDSFVTDEIDMVNGPKTLTASFKSTIGDAYYNLTPVYQ